MPTTRRQATLQTNGELNKPEIVSKPVPKTGRRKGRKSKKQEQETTAGDKREAEYTAENKKEEPSSKKPKVEEESSGGQDATAHFSPLTGTIERGHIYFFYRPKVQVEETESLDDIRNFHIVLVPRPAAFASHDESSKADNEKDENSEMTLLSAGADAVPAAEPEGHAKKFRVITVGKKQLPDPSGGGSGRGRKETFWATVSTVGDDLHKLESGLGEKEYETKTRGTRHEEPARLAGRGAYAIVNNNPSTPSRKETHLGYHLTHPSPSELGQVQAEMRIYQASSFIIQVRNPLAPVSGGQYVGLPQGKRAKYPENIMEEVFGEGTKGRDKYGLRFSAVTRPELLDYEGAELLLIGARSGEDGLETSLGEGRGEALNETAEKEYDKSIQVVLKELALDGEKIPAVPLKGEWL
ncbi:hypothetical protein NEOLEDRAFT_1083382 [Neolentinus lepideus HHB14362 ss-1]|uniref:Uncharacterized protein n=1 Tax=Neolentinus lepideus HHB14362 ss-1 TaxID=1314782 RepID=A0A165W9P0_9AGAM|nr:hypothetical protein NEOLEDRAFT_1083382 [Neolentinus lepideus HHB14362 ss-1]